MKSGAVTFIVKRKTCQLKPTRVEADKYEDKLVSTVFLFSRNLQKVINYYRSLYFYTLAYETFQTVVRNQRNESEMKGLVNNLQDLFL